MKNLALLGRLPAVKKALPALIRDRAGWKTLFVNYEKPHVARLWRDWEGLRISLHFIYPCPEGTSLFHRHSRPTAAEVIEGTYEMGIAHMQGETFGPIDCTMVFTAGSSYEMIDPDASHYVRPIGGRAATIFIMPNGPAFDRPVPKPTKQLFPLLPEEAEEMFLYFEQKFPL